MDYFSLFFFGKKLLVVPLEENLQKYRILITQRLSLIESKLMTAQQFLQIFRPKSEKLFFMICKIKETQFHYLTRIGRKKFNCTFIKHYFVLI
ncbi:hypothetical protein BpHYR1_007545 [Brachionus plicatilis]|uniref:Uncharacterized protein n=1 Tax=Brachionus plicatilis TaxID=10195 RepID=A0A3M7S1H6_BRAPC|nr:hypothetical protein BpHYR1_007545 [Brachionus plicatilis]